MSQSVVSTDVQDRGDCVVTVVTFSDGSVSQQVDWKPGTTPANQQSLYQQAAAALATNRTYVALASPTAAQTAAQVKALSRQNNGLIRLLLGLLDGTD
jgi:hypothetical protein